jgi:hypothetical protein
MIKTHDCGCVMDAFDHDGGCPRIHLVEKIPIRGIADAYSTRPLCGRDAYKLNRMATVRRTTSGFEMSADEQIKISGKDLDQVCLNCLNVFTKEKQ